MWRARTATVGSSLGPATQPQERLCDPGGSDVQAGRGGTGQWGGQGHLESHSLQDWLELDPGPPCHPHPRGGPPPQGVGRARRAAPTPRLMECSGRPGWALCPPCQALGLPAVPWVQDMPHSPNGQHQKLEKEAHPSRPQGPVDSGGPDVRLAPLPEAKGLQRCVGPAGQKGSRGPGEGSQRDRHTAVTLCGEAAEWLQGTQRTASSLQSPLLRGGHEAPPGPCGPHPDPGRRKEETARTGGCRAVCSGETLGRQVGHPVQLSPRSRVRGSGGKAREWRGWAGRGGRSGRLAARDLACGAQRKTQGGRKRRRRGQAAETGRDGDGSLTAPPHGAHTHWGLLLAPFVDGRN